MPFEPFRVGFLMQRAEMFVGADLLGMLRADWRVAGAAFLVLHLPVAEQIGGASTGTVSPSPSHPTDDSDCAVFEFKVFAH